MPTDVFGFPIDTQADKDSRGEFIPILKYDARAGRLSRPDRLEVNGMWESHAEDITNTFKALMDLENIEVGWIAYPPGSAPLMHLVKRGDLVPPNPGGPKGPDNPYKYGLRFMLKLARDIDGGKPIRELSGTSLAFRGGTGALVEQYLAERQQPNNQGLLPVVILERTVPQTTGSGQKSSTNYAPLWRIIGWAPRGDLQFIPKAMPVPQALAHHTAMPPGNGFATTNGAAPATGSQRAAPPQQQTGAPPWESTPAPQQPAPRAAFNPNDFG